MPNTSDETNSNWIRLHKTQALDLIDKLIRGVQEVELCVDDDLNIGLRPAGAKEITQAVSASDTKQDAIILRSDTGDMWVEGHPTETLTRMEFDLLEYLYSRSGSIVSREEICQRLWPERSAAESTAALDKLISRVRAKIEPSPGRAHYLLTVRGRGYRLTAE